MWVRYQAFSFSSWSRFSISQAPFSRCSAAPFFARMETSASIASPLYRIIPPLSIHVAHPADNTSACSSTVRVAFSCLSGG